MLCRPRLTLSISCIEQYVMFNSRYSCIYHVRSSLFFHGIRGAQPAVSFQLHTVLSPTLTPSAYTTGLISDRSPLRPSILRLCLRSVHIVLWPEHHPIAQEETWTAEGRTLLIHLTRNAQ